MTEGDGLVEVVVGGGRVHLWITCGPTLARLMSDMFWVCMKKPFFGFGSKTSSINYFKS